MHLCPHRIVTIVAGWGWTISGPMVIPVAACGGSSTALACDGYFPEHHGTIFHGKQAAVELIVRVLACLAEGLGMRATARVFEVAPKTVLQWLVEAAEQLRAFSAYFLCDCMWSRCNLTNCTRCCGPSKPVRSARMRRSSAGALALLGMDGHGPQEQIAGGHRCGLPHPGDGATRRASGGEGVSAGLCAAVFDRRVQRYGTAILRHCGSWIQPERRQDKGPMPKPRWMPLPELLYAQVVKSYRRRRIVGVKHRVVFGTRLAIEQVLARCGWTINTAFVERLNLDIRQCVAAIGRRVNTLCQGEAGLQDQLALFQTYHNFVLPHASLRQPLPVPEARTVVAQRRCGGRVPRRWRPD